MAIGIKLWMWLVGYDEEFLVLKVVWDYEIYISRWMVVKDM